MARILSGLMLLLPLWAAYAETPATPPPAEGSGSLGTIIFGVLFFGFCIGFIWMVMRNDKKQKQQGKEQQS